MSGSRGGGSRLSRKRKNEESTQSQLAAGLHDVTDDFEDIATVFRLPKRSKIEKLLGPRRSRGRPKKSGEGKVSADRPDSRISIYDEDDFSDAASVISEKASQEVIELEGNDFDLEIDESFLCKDEKLCGSCKHIVPAAIYGDHLKECLQKFRATKRSTRSGSSDSALPFSGNQENEKPEEKDTAGTQGKKGANTLPCPICLKPLKSKTARQSHIKSCGQSHGLDSEKLVLAVRLQEKQAEERNLLGLPPVAIEPSSVRQDKENEAVATGRPKRRAPAASSSKDPDLAMAIALSRSMAEEEAEKRASQEEKLLALGFDKIVEEDRKAKPVVLLPVSNGTQKTNTTKEKGRGARSRKKFRSTVLATRSLEERERIISEKVASILTSDVASNVNWKDNDSQGGRVRLAKFRDESCSLWNSAHSHLERPLEEFYVKDLNPYIQPKKAEVGRLHRRLSDIPGRLNVTVMHGMDENSDGGSDEEEDSVIDGYCTQLAMAELLGSQELNITRAQGSFNSLDLTLVQDLEDPVPGPNVTLEAASGFWLVHPEESKETSPIDDASEECLEVEEIKKRNVTEICKRPEGNAEKSDGKNSRKRDVDSSEYSEISDDDHIRTSENLQVHNSEKIGSPGKYSVSSDVEMKDEKLKGVKRVTNVSKLSGTFDSDEENLDEKKSDSGNYKDKSMPFDHMTSGNLYDVEDSEIMCILDTGMKNTNRHHASASTMASNAVTSESEGPYKELSRYSLQNDSHTTQVVSSEMQDRVGSSSPASSDSDKTEIFDDGNGGNTLQNLDEIDSVVGETRELEKGVSDCDLKCFSEETNRNLPIVRNEDINACDVDSPLLQSKNLVVDSESDEEGGAKTIVYDDASSRGSSSPSKYPHDGECDENAADDLDSTIPFQDERCKVSPNSDVLKAVASSDESCSPLQLLSALQKHENNKTDNTMDADETDLYVDEGRVQDKDQHRNDVNVGNQDLRGLNESDSQLNSKDLQETLLNEDFSKTGDTVIHAAFEETIPRRADDTVLYDDAINDQETMPFQDLSKLDRMVPHQLVNDQEETLPYENMDEGETVLPDKSSADVTILRQKTARDGLEETMTDQDETLPYEDDVSENTTVLLKGSCKEKTPLSLQKSQNGMKKIAVAHPSIECIAPNVNNSTAEVVKATGIDVDKRDTPIQDSPMTNISSMQKGASESYKAGDCSNTMHTRLIYDWSSLFASSEESDVTVTTADGEELSAHSIVFLARCPDLYAEVKKSNKHLMWDEVSYKGAYVFLAYLYNSECSIKTKDDPYWMDVFDLALKYNCEELVSHLESLYKIANSPVKSKESSGVELEPEFALPTLLPKCSESLSKKVENGKRSVLEEENSLMSVEKNSSLKRGLFPIHTSTVIRDNTVSLQTSTEMKAGSSVNQMPIVTPCRGRGTGDCKERIVRRCLDLSPIGKGVLLGDSNPSEARRSDESNAWKCQSPDNVSITAEKNSQHPHGSQSPDLFDSTVSMEVSYITTPAKSPLTLPSPEDMSAVGSPKGPNTEKVVDEIEVTDVTTPEPYSSNVQNLSSDKTSPSEILINQITSDSERAREQGQVHSGDIEQHGNDVSHTSETDLTNDDNVDICNKFSDVGEDDGDKDCSDDENGSDVDNLIDLTNDSSDDSVCGFSVGNNKVYDDATNLYAANTEVSTEDMETLKLVDSEESMNGDNISNVNEACNNICEKENGIEMAIDITHTSPSSMTSDQEDIRIRDKENEITSYISNVWDDFDDDVCGNLIDVPATPPAKESHAESDDLPSVEKLDGRESNGISNSQKDRNISTMSSDSGKSSASHDLSNELTDKASYTPCSNDFQKPSLSCVAVDKRRTGVPTISDATMANVREDLDDSSLWKDEFEPVFDVEGETVEETSTTDEVNPPKHMKTPQQKTGARKSVTPMPAYKEMPSPELKKELKKYGIKPISKKKAVTILEHIYEKTHPLVTDSEADSSYCETPQQPKPKQTKAEKRVVSAIHKKAVAQNQTKSKNLEKEPTKDSTKGNQVKASASKSVVPVVDDEDDDDSPLNSSQTSTTSSEGSQPDCFEESVLLGTGDDDTDLTAIQQGDLANQIAQYIVSDPEFHQKVLLYEPFFVEDLQASLKANGVKCGMRNILEILDNQCITFRTHQGQRIRQRGRKCKRKNVGTPNKTPAKRKKKS